MRWWVAQRPFLAVSLSPITRLVAEWREAPVATGLLAGAAGVIQVVTQDVFTPIAALVLFSGIVDTIYGRIAASIFDEFDEAKAAMGLHSKIMGLALAFLLRGFEAWIASIHTGPMALSLDTAGGFAAAVATSLFVQDVRSIQAKRMRFGQGPIPVLGRVLEWMDRFSRALGAPTPTAPLMRRPGVDDP